MVAIIFLHHFQDKNYMKFTERYPNLFQFFSGYFPDSDFDALTNEEVVEKYIVDCNKSEKSMDELQETKKELAMLSYDCEIYWKDIMDLTNIYFESPNQTSKWLKQIQKIMELSR